MEEPERPPRERHDGTLESITHAHEIVAEELGDDFYLWYTGVKNVGIVGDKGIYGDTVIIIGRSQSATQKLLSDDDLIRRVSSRLWNESWPITRVLIDFTSLGTAEEE